MTWVKQNYDRFLLAIMALVLAVCAGMLFNNAHSFNAVFDKLNAPVPHNTALPPEATNSANEATVVREQASLAKPDQWNARVINEQRLPLLVSVPYIAKTVTPPDGGAPHTVLINPFIDDPNGYLHPPIPNSWLIEHHQDILASNVLDQDSDGDGFSTLDEYQGKTNPEDKNSHPPYWTKLYLKRFYRIPFVLRFDARNGDRFQVNTVDENDDEPTQFVKVGDTVKFKETRFKVTKFVEKFTTDHGFKRDVSELTLVNVKDPSQVVVLPKETDVDSPTTYAIFTYLWTGKEFAVLKGGEFTLAPEDKVKYKVLEMSDTEIKVLKEDENLELHIRMRST